MRNLLVFGLFAAAITPLGCSTDESGAGGGTPAGAGQSSSAGTPTGSGASNVGTGGSSTQGGGSSQAGVSSQAGTAPAAGSGGTIAVLPATLKERIKVSEIEVAAGVKDGVMNWRIWGRGDLNVAPVFSAPLANCETLVCFTTGTEQAPVARVVRLGSDDKLVGEVVNQAGVECRGVAAGAGGQFAALLWSGSAETIAVTRYDAAGTALGSTPLENSDNHPTDFEIGEARLEFGDAKYGAYYHVHSDSGHEGDTLKWVDAASGAETTEWTWGCSHSMSNLLRYHPTLGAFLPACVTDCYPGTDGDFATQSIGGIYLNHDEQKVLDVDAGCNGSVAGELGSAALAPMGYKLVFNAHQAAAGTGQDSYEQSNKNQDIGFSAVAQDRTPAAVVWLTTTPVDEADASIARYEPTGGAEQYLVGWVETGNANVFKLALVDPNGTFLEAPFDATAQVKWGRRDDPFRQHVGGDVVWAWFDSAGSKTLHFARVDSGAAAACQ
jgi:hypothetical protein